MFLVAVQVFLALLLVLLVLLQSPESDSLGSFGGAQCNLGSVFGKGSPSSLLARLTAVVAAVFILNTLLLVGIGSKSIREVSVTGEPETVSGREAKTGEVPSE
ncbi:preprotein translocase subunit SecG [Candidatus Anaplasma sp. TIGMIC]|uniref:preprotein translocase subunit SecG n=1 Tax=Candidatus Anaplasma sp. TIGMIC TaxID=3020713 RepID=UPI00232D011E|nr:preprotein translocase subunit SecG [Candidatus Anaplasma sp. TIGMIC]